MVVGNPYASEVESSQVIPALNVAEVDVNPNQRLSLVLLNEFNYQSRRKIQTWVYKWKH